jgi:nicotinamidase-related amidase
MGDILYMKTLDEILIDGKDTALVVIDVVKDICAEGFRYAQLDWDRKPILEMVHDSLLPFIQRSRGRLPIAFVRSEYQPREFENDPYPITGMCLRGTDGAGFYLLRAENADNVFVKNHWSALLEYPYENGTQTELHKWLQQIDIHSLIIAGLTFTHCIPQNIGHALQLGYGVILPRNLVASRGERIEGSDGHKANIKKYEEHPRVLVIESFQITYITK